MNDQSECRKSQGSLAREIKFVFDHAESGLTPQSQRLLSFLFKAGPAADPDQNAIAADLFGRNAGFRSDEDSHVRVAVSRLRKSLTAFYDRHGTFRPARLVIPKGQYRVVAIANDTALPGGDATSRSTPFFNWIVTTDPAPEAQSLGHRIDRLLTARIAEAPFVHDGAIRADRLPAWSLSAAMDEAQRTGAACLAKIHVAANGNRVSLGLHCPRDRHAAVTQDFDNHQDTTDFEMLVRRLVVSLTDPLYSVLPRRLALAYPQSRLALAMRFFRFMATQDRTLLPGCLDVLECAAGSRLSSPLIDALRVDAIRANHAFATGAGPELGHGLLETASRVLERDPYQPYAALAHAYAAIAGDADDLPDAASLGNKDVFWEGSILEDRGLCLTLASIRGDVLPDLAADKSGTFFGDLSHVLAAMLQEDFEAAAHKAFASRQNENFWTRTFQCSIAIDLGQEQQARQIYAKLKSEVPQVEDFAGRAIVTMIPNRELRSRMLHNLSMMP